MLIFQERFLRNGTVYSDQDFYHWIKALWQTVGLRSLWRRYLIPQVCKETKRSKDSFNLKHFCCSVLRLLFGFCSHKKLWKQSLVFLWFGTRLLFWWSWYLDPMKKEIQLMHWLWLWYSFGLRLWLWSSLGLWLGLCCHIGLWCSHGLWWSLWLWLWLWYTWVLTWGLGSGAALGYGLSSNSGEILF